VSERSVKDWFVLLQEKDDIQIAKQVLVELPQWPKQERVLHLLSLLTAVRLDQMAKENS
jgi:hypothetical protein